MTFTEQDKKKPLRTAPGLFLISKLLPKTLVLFNWKSNGLTVEGG
jgi:hypothetical protein